VATRCAGVAQLPDDHVLRRREKHPPPIDDRWLTPPESFLIMRIIGEPEHLPLEDRTGHTELLPLRTGVCLVYPYGSVPTIDNGRQP